jgi:hypothetical protein
LRAGGIAVFRRLETKVFRRLVGAVREHAGSGLHLLTSSQ